MIEKNRSYVSKITKTNIIIREDAYTKYAYITDGKKYFPEIIHSKGYNKDNWSEDDIKKDFLEELKEMFGKKIKDTDITGEFTKKQIEYYKENRCSNAGCPNLCAKGYTVCEHCLYDAPSRIPQKVLNILDGTKKEKNLLGDIEDLTDKELKKEFFICKREIECRNLFNLKNGDEI